MCQTLAILHMKLKMTSQIQVEVFSSILSNIKNIYEKGS